MVAFTGRTSIFGRRLMLTSSGGFGNVSSGSTESGPDQVAQMWGSGINNTVTSTIGSTLSNSGLTRLSSGAAAGSTALSGFEIAAPVVGVRTDIHLETSSSEISIGGTSTAIVFKPVVGGAGSTLFVAALPLAGKTISLVGISTAVWAVLGSTAGITIG